MRIGLGVFYVFSLVVIGSGADWLQWGGRDSRNAISDETGLPEAFDPSGKGDSEASGNVKWSVRLGSYIYGNPTVADGRVFVGTDDLSLTDDPRLERSRSGMVKCLDAASGDILWQLAIPKRSHGLPKEAHYGHQHLGVCSSPAVDGDRVYVVSSANEVLCLDINGMADGNDGPFQDEGQYMVGPGQKPIEPGPTDADIVWLFDMIAEVDARYRP
jgi:hypothetical protein